MSDTNLRTAAIWYSYLTKCRTNHVSGFTKDGRPRVRAIIRQILSPWSARKRICSSLLKASICALVTFIDRYVRAISICPDIQGRRIVTLSITGRFLNGSRNSFRGRETPTLRSASAASCWTWRIVFSSMLYPADGELLLAGAADWDAVPAGIESVS